MRELILIKYSSEIFLKGQNRRVFEDRLKKNIKKVIGDLEYEFIIDQSRWLIATENTNEVLERVKKVFGVLEVCIVNEIESDFDKICEEALKVIKKVKPKTFKVVTKRANKRFPMDSMEVSRKLGGYILQNTTDLEVDVRSPEFVLEVEIRENAYIYNKKIRAVGGLPYGMNGSTMLMLSGGIDSPVAGYLMARRGVTLNCVYYHSHPYTSEQAKEKVIDLAKILVGYTGSVNLYIVPFTDIQMEIMDKCREDELTIIMRRFMMRIACALAEKKGVNSVSSGESIGQVASQTMEGLTVSTDVSDRPIFRPLIAMDKEDIMRIAQDIGTYETSILPYEDCCTIFTPKHPKTKPKIEGMEKAEKSLDVEAMVEKAIEEMELIKL